MLPNPDHCEATFREHRIENEGKQHGQPPFFIDDYYSAGRRLAVGQQDFLLEYCFMDDDES
jgi:hypothetical protein